MATSPASLPNPSDAYQHLFNNVHAEVFFQKLASAGITPANAAEAEQLLALGGKLRPVGEAQKQASRYDAPLRALDAVLGTTPAEAHSQQIQHGNAIKAAAAQLAADPSIYASVLSLKAAEAQVLAANS